MGAEKMKKTKIASKKWRMAVAGWLSVADGWLVGETHPGEVLMNQNKGLAIFFCDGELALLYPPVNGGAMRWAIEEAKRVAYGRELAHPADFGTVYQGELAVAGSGAVHVSG